MTFSEIVRRVEAKEQMYSVVMLETDVTIRSFRPAYPPECEKANRKVEDCVWAIFDRTYVRKDVQHLWRFKRSRKKIG